MKLVSTKDDHYENNEGQSLSASEVAQHFRQDVIEGTLIRRIEHFDPSFVTTHKRINLDDVNRETVCFTLAKRDLPHMIPENWQLEDAGAGQVKVTTDDKSGYLVESHHALAAQAAGQLPCGLEPAEHYNSRFHPRGLQMTLLGASDALHASGIPIDTLMNSVPVDQIGVYSSSIVGQVSEEGLGGVLQARLKGNRTTAKQLPLGLNTMPADFINAYVLGSAGHTEAITGACASFLYLVQAAVRDITSGARRIAVVGNADAVVVPEVMEGFISMSALGNDDNLCKLEGKDPSTEKPDWRRASRPFGKNCGFTIAESSQYIVLMDDALAIELGADIQGAIPGVFINADGIKKSISAPGAGNTICFAKAVALAMNIAGEESVKKHSFVHAHGSSTPANRVTESDLINRVAESFDIENWPVTAAKAYVGHSLSCASGDQLMSALGTFHYQIIPGIKTVDGIAEDVIQTRTQFPLTDLDTKASPMELAFINSKGFGGNNATAVILSPDKTRQLLSKRHNIHASDYAQKLSATRANATAYETNADKAQLNVIYRFGEPVIDEKGINIDTRKGIQVPGFKHTIPMPCKSQWADLT